MSLKGKIKKLAKFILTATPDKNVQVNVQRIDYKDILKNRNIIITGGNQGIGLEIAKKCIELGANIIICGRNEKLLEKAKEILGEKCKTIKFDVSKVDKIKDFLEECETKLNGKEIDSIVLNAGVSHHEGNYLNVSENDFDLQFDINLKANYFLAKEFIKRIKQREEKYGNIVFISSETGSESSDIPYGLTKSALNSLTGALSRRVYCDNIRVNAVAPGVTMSNMTNEYTNIIDNNLYRKNAAERIFLPEEIAEVVTFLLSDASKCISGEVIHCDAGNHLRVQWEEN